MKNKKLTVPSRQGKSLEESKSGPSVSDCSRLPLSPVGGGGGKSRKGQSSAGRRSRRKGAVGERELAAVLRSHGFTGAKRGQQRSGLEQADVVDGPKGWHLECKRVERLNVFEAFRQATRDAPPGTVPMVATRRSGEEWLAVVELDVLLALIGWARDVPAMLERALVARLRR